MSGIEKIFEEYHKYNIDWDEQKQLFLRSDARYCTTEFGNLKGRIGEQIFATYLTQCRDNGMAIKINPMEGKWSQTYYFEQVKGRMLALRRGDGMEHCEYDTVFTYKGKFEEVEIKTGRIKKNHLKKYLDPQHEHHQLRPLRQLSDDPIGRTIILPSDQMSDKYLACTLTDLRAQGFRVIPAPYTVKEISSEVRNIQEGLLYEAEVEEEVELCGYKIKIPKIPSI